MRQEFDIEEEEDDPTPNEAGMVVHYYLDDNKHSMDAFIRNKAEAEMLALVRHVLLQLNLQVTVETSAHGEGGVIENWLLALSHTEMIALGLGATTVASTALLGIINIIIALMNMDREGKRLTRELTTVSIEEKKLAVEEKRLNLEKIRSELLKSSPDQAVIEAAIPALAYDVKTITLRSNYYKTLIPYSPVSAVGFGPKQRGRRAQQERIVHRQSFQAYVVTSDKLPKVVYPEAVIEIVAPVLNKGAIQWRGLFNGESITFQMRDAAYRGMVHRGEVTFKHGDKIKCVLNIERKVDAVGEEVIAGRSVSVVCAKIEGDKVTETIKGRRLAYANEIAQHVQFSLDLGKDPGEPPLPLT
ncbi:MAG: hypothetical protein IV097_00335 [Burkholderiaceae bacterium]|nr:hypothetical protein [Burkholderiaceae bacterium]